jgi:hypothetical protein
VLAAARDLHIEVPDELSVVGYGEIDAAGHVDPPLTTVSLPAEEMGLLAGRRLAELIRGRPSNWRDAPRRRAERPAELRAALSDEPEGVSTPRPGHPPEVAAQLEAMIASLEIDAHSRKWQADPLERTEPLGLTLYERCGRLTERGRATR